MTRIDVPVRCRLLAEAASTSIAAAFEGLALAALAVMASTSPCQAVGDSDTLLPRGLTHNTVEGDPFRHVVVRSPSPGGPSLHVYVEGDGVPYIGTRVASADPTSRTGLLLLFEIMHP